jgi:hypothetical protein
MIDEALLLILSLCRMTSMKLQLPSAQRLVRRVQLPDEQSRDRARRRRAAVCMAAVIVSWVAIALPSVRARTAAPVQAAAATLRNIAGNLDETTVSAKWMQFWHRVTLQSGGGVMAVSSGSLHGIARVYVDDLTWLLVSRSSGKGLGAVTGSMWLTARMIGEQTDMGFSELEQIRAGVNTMLAAQGLSLHATGVQQPPVYNLTTTNGERRPVYFAFVRLAGSDGTGGAVVDLQTMSITTLCDRTQASGLLVTDSGVVVVSQ